MQWTYVLLIEASLAHDIVGMGAEEPLVSEVPLQPYAMGLGAQEPPVSVEGYRGKATRIRELKLPRREADPPNHLDDVVDSDQ